MFCASVTDANTRTTSFEYDGESRLTAVVDPLTRRAEREYDALGRLKRDLRNTTNATESATTVNAYDPLDRVTQVLDPNEKSTAYEYTAFGEVSKLTSPDTGVTDYTYNARNLQESRTEALGSAEARTLESRFDDADAHYAIRAFVRVKQGDGCPPLLVWSEMAPLYRVLLTKSDIQLRAFAQSSTRWKHTATEPENTLPS